MKKNGNLFAAILGLIVGLALALWYSARVNPEMKFWSDAYQIKAAHAAALDREGKPKIVFSGGSSCAFQIDTETLASEFSLPSVNMGLHAGMGAYAILGAALANVKPHDALVVALEPGLLGGELRYTPLGYQFTSLLVGPGSAKALPDLEKDYASRRSLVAFSPGLYNLATMGGKLLFGRPMYRYFAEEIGTGGTLSTRIQEEQTGDFTDGEIGLSPQAKALLRQVADWARENDVHVSYLMPLMYFEEQHASAARARGQEFARKVGAIIPVIPDPAWGVGSDVSQFADTGLHLTPEGAIKRTRAVGGLLTGLLKPVGESRSSEQGGDSKGGTVGDPANF